jgi:uncharacterized alpha-E superfamily protein
MAAVAGLAVTASIEAEGWPFVTLGAFQQQAKNVQYIAGSIYLTLNPIVQAADLNAWESYVQSPANSWM